MYRLRLNSSELQKTGKKQNKILQETEQEVDHTVRVHFFKCGTKLNTEVNALTHDCPVKGLPESKTQKNLTELSPSQRFKLHATI